MAFLLGIAAATLLTLLALLTVIILEHVGPRERYSLRDRLPGVMMDATGTFLSFALVSPLSWAWAKLGLAPLIMIPLWQWLAPLGSLGYAFQIILFVVLADLLTYWRHRAEHAWFWPIHVVHHAPRELHAANDIGHPLQILINFTFVSVPLSLIQFDGPEAPFAVGAIVGIANMYIHSPVEWHFGPLRKLIVDNRFHRIHHSLEERHFDKNFGICFSFWDYLFGTAYEPGEEWPAVGVDGVPAPRNVAQYLCLPLTVGRRTQAIASADPATSALANRLQQEA